MGKTSGLAGIPKRDLEYHRRHGILGPRRRYWFRPEDKLMAAIFGSDEERFWMAVHSALLRKFLPSRDRRPTR